VIEVVSVIGGGWSLGMLSPEERERIPGHRIGVNDSFLHLGCDEGVTMDRLWTENRWRECELIARPLSVRDTALRNIKAQPLWLTAFACDHDTDRMSDIRGTYNGRNSGACAINVAFQMKPRFIILWGFDMCRSPKGEPYWYPVYPWSRCREGNTPPRVYQDWSAGFRIIAAQCAEAGISVINASPVSAITTITKVDPCKLLMPTTSRSA